VRFDRRVWSAPGCYARQHAENLRSEASTALLDPRDRDALLDAGNRLLLQGLGVDNALEFLRLIGGGRDRFEDVRKQWAGLTVDEALNELRRAGSTIAKPTATRTA
jgi:hypothetical protein